MVSGCLKAPYHFLKAAVAPMVEQGEGQLLLDGGCRRPSAHAGRAPVLVSHAAATMLARNVAAEVARNGVQVNAVGTNFMDFPEFLGPPPAEHNPEVRSRLEARGQLRRLGPWTSSRPSACAFVDGSSRFTTGQAVAYAGGWA